MKISSATFAAEQAYALVTMEGGEVFIVDTTLPPDEQVRRILADWLAAGGEIAPYVAPEAPIPNITQRQLRLWLVRNGYPLATVETALDNLPEPGRSEALIEWDCASEFKPDHPTLLDVAAVLGIPDVAQAAREAALI
ncbi:MAG: hypothetical protein QHC89_01835 [Bosea sp. (in: a-proteobacteria)]|nr:hypothetical protein [Bosea sp. (in: a-proteobacteria)]